MVVSRGWILSGVSMTLGFTLCTSTWAGLDVPAYSSRPGAAYTLYLDFGGFTYNGTWGSSGKTPGTIPAYDTNNNTAAFSTTELTNIQQMWARVSQEYIGFNINVTTLDPAIAAGKAGTDTERWDYYDSSIRTMHTIIGGNNTWYGGGGGVSYVGVAVGTSTNGRHTNFVFPNNLSKNSTIIAQAATHEDGHGLGLNHQSDYTGTTKVNEYSAGTGTGSGSIAPVMGVSYYAQRGLWSVGTVPSTPTIQNDPKTIANLAGMNGFVSTGIGQSFANATPLPLNSGTIDFTQSSSIITPKSKPNPTPLGAENYTNDFWWFHTTGGNATLTVNSGTQFISPGTPDPGSTLNALMGVYDSNQTLIQQTAVSLGNLSKTLSLTLPAGDYYAKIFPTANSSDTAYTQRDFFDMGAYFLTGTIAVPEPASLCLLAIGPVVLVLRPRRQA